MLPYSAGIELPVSFHFIPYSCSLDVCWADSGKHVHFSQLLSPPITRMISKVQRHAITTEGFSSSRKADVNVKLLHHSWMPKSGA